MRVPIKLNALGDLLGLFNRRKDLPSWGLALLLLLLVTIFGFAVRGPLHSFPNLSQNSSLERDPYGLHSGRETNDRPALVETGL